MLLIVVLLLIVVPLAELYVMVQVAQQIGVLETLLALLVISMIGVWVVRTAGLGMMARALGSIGQGRVPTDDLIGGGLVVVAGALLFLPGFLGDVIGVALLLPPVRAAVRPVIRRRVARRVQRGRTTVFGSRFGRVVDVDGQPVWRPSRQNELP